LTAARALVLSQYLNVGNDPNRIVQEFKARYYDTQLFFDKFARSKFAQYLFIRHENPSADPDEDQAHQLVEEAQLFIEATHACEARVNGVIVS
jgi:sulfite reductase (ferredoxin)